MRRLKSHAFHPEAAEEYAQSVQYYSNVHSDLGLRFYQEIERLIQDIRRDPARFQRFDPPAQRHFSNVFPYAIIYAEHPDRIWILAVMHMKRRPGYWKKRI
jgi:hypothetical protein